MAVNFADLAADAAFDRFRFGGETLPISMLGIAALGAGFEPNFPDFVPSGGPAEGTTLYTPGSVPRTPPSENTPPNAAGQIESLGGQDLRIGRRI